MSYPGFQGHNANYGSSSTERNSAHGAGRSSSAAAAAAAAPPASTYPAYPVSSSQQQYGSTAYAWPDRNQSTSHNMNGMNGNTQHYGSAGWKEGQGQQSTYEYDFQRPQTNYATPPTTNHTPHNWYGANTQTQAQPSTQALSNLAYASGLNSHQQQARDDCRTTQSNQSSQQFNPAQREGHGQERLKSPSYGPGYTTSHRSTSQAEHNPSSSHLSLAVSPADALAGAVNRRFNTSPAQPDLSMQQYQRTASAVANPGYPNPANTVIDQRQQRRFSSHDASAHGQPKAQLQATSGVRAQPSHNLNRYETSENYRHAYSAGPNVTLPLPSAARTGPPKPSYEPTQRPVQKNVGADLSIEKPTTGSLDTTTSNVLEPSDGMSRQQIKEPATSRPTFIDPSQVFDPYRKEHERQKREEAERAKRASMEASVASTRAKSKEASTNQPINATVMTAVPDSKQQAPKSASTEASIRRSSQSSSTTAEAKESGDVDMANEMKSMMQRIREWKTKDPSLFQKLWDDMKKGGSTTQPSKGQTPGQSPQLVQVTPQQPPTSQDTQLRQPQTSSAPQKVSPKTTASSRTASKVSSHPKRHWDLTMAIENNEESLPDLGRFPAERRNRRSNQEIVEQRARRRERMQAAQTPPTILSQNATQIKKDDKLVWPKGLVPHAPPVPDAFPGPVPSQTLPPISPNGGTIWPEAKRKALAEAAQKALIGLPANQDKFITAAEINSLLEQNPSYIELCGRLEARGFVFHRGQFARFLLNKVPDLAAPSQTQHSTPQQAAGSTSTPAELPREAAPNGAAGSTSPPAELPREVVPSGATARLQKISASIPSGHSPQPSPTYINYRIQPAPPPKATPSRLTKPRLGVPSPNIPTPVPGSKEANAKKRDFSELVDLTQLSDDEDYVMPRKQARREASPDEEAVQVKSAINPLNPARQFPNMQRHSNGSSSQNPSGLPGGVAPFKFDVQAQSLVSELRSQMPAQSTQATLQRSRHLLAKPLNKAEALRKSYYDPKTVARDILIAAGRHPGEHPLNTHLAGLLGKHIDIDSDLSTFDWDSVDPGGPPMPVVQVVDIPAGPPRWKLGQRGKARGPAIGTFDPPLKARVDERVKVPRLGTTMSNGTPVHRAKKVSNSEKPGQDHVLDVPSSLARLSSQTKSLLQDSSKPQKPSHQPTQLRKPQNASEDPKTPARASSRQKTTPHRTNSITPIMLNSPFSQHSHKRGPGRSSKSSTIEEPSSAMKKSLPATVKRRGRPPGIKSKGPSAYMLKKAAKASSLQVSPSASKRSPSPPRYSIYACKWRNCDAKLHNLSTLRKHIAKVHKIPDDEINDGGQPCWWKKCRTLEIEAEEIIPKVTFNSTSDWLEHIESDHLHPLGMKLGDGPSSAQTGKPQKAFEVSKYFYHPPSALPPSVIPVLKARTRSHTDPQTLARDRQLYLSDEQGRAVTPVSTKNSILDYPSDTLVLSSVTMNPESNIPNRAFSKAHGNEKMEIRQSATETLVALQRHKERIGPGLDRGGCTLVNAERRATLLDTEGMARVVDEDY